MPRRNIRTLLLFTLVCLLCQRRAEENRYSRYLREVFGTIESRALEGVDESKLYQAGLRGMLNELDEYTGYISEADVARFNEDLEQEFAGIGIQIRPEPIPLTESHELIVVTPIVGTPAHAAGIHAGDVLLEVDGKSLAGVDVEEAVRLMRGPPGKPIVIKLRRADTGKEETIEIQRAAIQVASVLGDSRKPDGGWSFVLESETNIGYIRILQFGSHTDAELRAALEELKKVPDLRGVIFDLRGNSGGLLSAAVRVCDLLLSEGTIVTTRGRTGKILEKYSANEGAHLVGVPFVVLVDKYSASASEIFAACLQDHKRATIVGERTWGKGTVQTVLDIEDGRAALRLTTAGYWRPSGQNIHRSEGMNENDTWGVRPLDSDDLVKLEDAERLQVLRDRQRRDIVGPAPPANSDNQEGPVADRQLDRAVSILTSRGKS